MAWLNVLVERQIYTLSASPKTRFSDWVAYKVTKASQAGSKSERNWSYCTDERHVTVEEVEARTELDLFPKFAETTVIERRLAPEVGCP